MSEPAVTVVIPSIPPRAHLLARALSSVARQTYAPVHISLEIDENHTGAAETRQRALDRVTTPYVAFLDDDDELWPRHLELLIAHQIRTGADLVYPWFEVDGGEDLLEEHFGREFDPDSLRRANYIPVTVLARTDRVRAAGGFTEDTDAAGSTNEDWALWKRMLDQGAAFAHLPKQTWTWYRHGSNTMGNRLNW